jgi:HSP20 family molecular chaperone IbpA
MDAYLLADRLVVHADLPDADPETVSVGLAGDVLTVTAARLSGHGQTAATGRRWPCTGRWRGTAARRASTTGVVTVMVSLRDGTDA